MPASTSRYVFPRPAENLVEQQQSEVPHHRGIELAFARPCALGTNMGARGIAASAETRQADPPAAWPMAESPRFAGMKTSRRSMKNPLMGTAETGGQSAHAMRDCPRPPSEPPATKRLPTTISRLLERSACSICGSSIASCCRSPSMTVSASAEFTARLWSDERYRSCCAPTGPHHQQVSR